MSNSVLFGVRERNDSLEGAVGRVGFQNIYRLVGLSATQQVCQRDLSVYGLKASRLWENAVATAAAAPPTDLAANLRDGSDKNARALLLSFTLHSWSTLYGFSMDGITNRANQGIIHRLAENNCISLEKKPKFGMILGVLTIARATKNKDIARIEPWGSFARANSVDAARVPGPLLIAQSSKDTIIAPAVTRKFAKAVCRRGTALRWIEMTGGHVDAARDSAQETIGWIGARFDGNPPPNDCRRI
eukprot:gene2399-3120_t